MTALHAGQVRRTGGAFVGARRVCRACGASFVLGGNGRAGTGMRTAQRGHLTLRPGGKAMLERNVTLHPGQRSVVAGRGAGAGAGSSAGLRGVPAGRLTAANVLEQRGQRMIRPGGTGRALVSTALQEGQTTRVAAIGVDLSVE